MYFNFPHTISESIKVSTIAKQIEGRFREGDVRIGRTEAIRIKIKRLVQTCKKFVAKRKVAGTSKPEKKRRETFHRNIHAVFEVLGKSCNFEQQSHDSNIQFPEYSGLHLPHELNLLSNSGDPNHDSDPDYDPSEDCFTHTKKPIPNDLLRKVSESKGSYRLCETLLNVGVQIAGGDPSAYSISRGSLWTKVTELRSNQKNELLSLLATDTCKVVIHFDGKKCTRINERHLAAEERIIVLCHTQHGDVPLGFFVVESKSGIVCANQILQSLTEHNLLNRIVGLVCDTESTNTGRFNGACALIENILEVELLHLMCRHHIQEVILKHVFVAVIGSSQASRITTLTC